MTLTIILADPDHTIPYILSTSFEILSIESFFSSSTAPAVILTSFKLSQSQPGPSIHPSIWPLILPPFSLFLPPFIPIILYKVLDIHIAWTKKRSLRVFRKTKISHWNPPMGDFLDDKTEHTHVRGPPSSKAGDFRKVKRVKSSDDSPWLDDVTLGEMDPEQSPQKSWRQKAAWIQTWAKRVPWDAMKEIH